MLIITALPPRKHAIALSPRHPSIKLIVTSLDMSSPPNVDRSRRQALTTGKTRRGCWTLLFAIFAHSADFFIRLNRAASSLLPIALSKVEITPHSTHATAFTP